eukprot:767669-Hanusia_phi.AAC.11
MRPLLHSVDGKEAVGSNGHEADYGEFRPCLPPHDPRDKRYTHGARADSIEHILIHERSADAYKLGKHHNGTAEKYCSPAAPLDERFVHAYKYLPVADLLGVIYFESSLVCNQLLGIRFVQHGNLSPSSAGCLIMRVRVGVGVRVRVCVLVRVGVRVIDGG